MTLNRRNFIAGTAAMAASLGMNPFLSAAMDKSGPKLGLTTYMIGRKWTIEDLIKNLTEIGIEGVELRTDMKFAHGVELTVNAARRKDLRKRFSDSPIAFIGLASSERFDYPDPQKVEKAIEKTKKYLQLCSDLGMAGLRVFPNSFHKDVPKEKTIDQIIESLRKLTKTADDLQQEICLEAHGDVGTLSNLRTIVEAVGHKRVRIMLNSDFRDTQGDGLEANLQLTADYLAGRAHIHNLLEKKYVDAKFYERQFAFFKKVNWSGWCLLEISDVPNDRIGKLKEMKMRWDQITAS